MDSTIGWMDQPIKEILSKDIEMVMVYGSLKIKNSIIKDIIF